MNSSVAGTDASAIRCYVRPRPIRVAYLVDENEYSQQILDAVFAECFSRWGGRYSLVVPSEGGKPEPAYMPWLEAYDPDVVYVYGDIEEPAVADLHERLGPAYVSKHDAYDGEPRNAPDFRPRLPLDCLTSLSLIPQYTRAHPPSAPRPRFIVDYGPGYGGDRFVDDNFGTAWGSFLSSPLPGDLADGLQAITLVPGEPDPRVGIRLKGETVHDVASLLRAMAENRRSLGVAQLAADLTPRIEVGDGRVESLSLVVGDHFADRILFWNLRSLMPTYLCGITSLIVSPSRLEDDEFFAALVDFVHARNGVHPTNGNRSMQLLSASLGTKDLERVRERFNGHGQPSPCYVRRQITLDDIVPGKRVLDRALSLTTGHPLRSAVRWSEFSVMSSEVRLPEVSPHHLEGTHPRSPAARGLWALDLDIERRNNLARADNVRYRWRLPRRLRMHGAFLRRNHGLWTQSGPLGHLRSSREGFLTAFSGFDVSSAISIPDDETAFQYGLERGRDWPAASRKEGRKFMSGSYGRTRPSDKGRYLVGALELFGGMQKAGSVLLHPYWKTVFARFGGAVAADRHGDIKRVLKKRLRSGTISGDDEWDRLAGLVSQEAQRVRMPSQTLSYEDLTREFEPFLEKEREQLRKNRVDDPEEWLIHSQRSLPESVMRLCSRSVLYQGYELQCPRCLHSNWKRIGELQPEVACEVCGIGLVIPVDKPWDFRLNGFLREGLKEHGLLALVWCLIRLERRARETFWFLGPRELFINHPDHDRRSADHEADLVCIIDGKVFLCEVKNSGRDIGVSSLVDVAKRIRPDRVVLAVFDSETNRLRSKADELADALRNMEISSELITLEDGDMDSLSILPGYLD